jgi:hypothetical protein
MKPLAQFVWLVVPLGAALACDHYAGGRHAGESGESDELPGDTHRFA